MAKTYDVWVTASNRIYKGVPFNVVTDWAQQGRLGNQDKLRAAGTQDAWTPVKDDPSIADYLYAKSQPKAAVTQTAADAPPSTEVRWSGRREDDDDDPDMIPLIDISLVLLIFFMMTSAVSSLSPINVPQMKNEFKLAAPDDFVLIAIDKRGNGQPKYSLRVGDKPAAAEDDDKDKLEQILERLDDVLKKRKTAPEVRFACHRDLPSEIVHDLLKELEKRKGKTISRYYAEVVEVK